MTKQSVKRHSRIKRLLFGAAAAASVVQFMRTVWPEARRYLRIKQM